VHKAHAGNRSRWANVHAENHAVARRSTRSGTMIFLIEGPYIASDGGDGQQARSIHPRKPHFVGILSHPPCVCL